MHHTADGLRIGSCLTNIIRYLVCDLLVWYLEFIEYPAALLNMMGTYDTPVTRAHGHVFVPVQM